MVGHDIIVIGASAGGLEALLPIVRGLPAQLAATIFVVQHIHASVPSQLPEILSHAGDLPARHPTDHEPILPGIIYVAPPDMHLLLGPGHIHIDRGLKENGFRPAIDATLRTAAQSYGPRVVGVILSGMLDDGTAGLLAVKRHGGIAIVQAPADAAYPDMPTSALRYVEVDAVANTAEIPTMLIHLANEPVKTDEETPMPENLALESHVFGTKHAALQRSEGIETPVPFSCPACNGVLNEYYDGTLLRFRCQIDHSYSPESLFANQANMLDHQLWAAYRALNERLTLAKRLAHDAQRLNDQSSQRRFLHMVAQIEVQKEQLRETLLNTQ